MAMTKVKNLQIWCKRMADGYRDVEVRDMSASWKSGLAFCAIIHRFRPDLIDYDSLSKENVFDNNQLAFEVAEKQLNIPAFLEAADMVAIRVPDRLSVVTYVSQYYNYFHDKPQLGGPGVKKCTTPSKKKEPGTLESKSLTPSQNITDNQQTKKNRQESIGDKCMMCHDKVYLLERHIENGKLYHRSCFRKSELSPTTKVFKRQPFSAIAEDKETSSATKLRKIEDEKDPDKRSGPEPDFWQRRAEAKAKKGVTVNDTSDVLKKFDVKSKPDVASDVPSWKKDRDIKTTSSSTANPTGFDKLDTDKKYGSDIPSKPLNNLNNSSALENYSKKPTKAGDLVNKFRELDERNLKSKQGDDKVKDFGKSPVIETNKSDFPKPKPRQTFMTTHEKMDISEPASVISQPKAKPRGLKTREEEPPAKPDHLKSAFINKTTDRPKSEFTRPKTPPTIGKSDFKLNISSVSSTKSDLKSPSSPPPLPSSTPPSLLTNDSNNSSLPSPRFGKKVSSPRLSPRNNDKNKNRLGEGRNNATNVPSKPDRSSSPMDTSEKPVAYKAVVHEPSGYKAVVSAPKGSGDEKQSREVLGGLLKSLANVRTKHDKDLDKSSDISSNKGESKQTIGAHKIQTNASSTDTSKVKIPPRPKSSFVSQSSHLFGDKENSKDTNVKGTVTTKKTTTTTTITTKQTGDGLKPKTVTTKTTTSDITKDDIPEWKKQLEKRKQEKARPKSADLLSDKSGSKNDNENMLEWQKEAEARKQARKGGYVDPEKPNSSAAKNEQNNRFNRPLSPYQKKSEDIIDKYVPPKDKDININKSKSPERHKFNGDTGKNVGVTPDKKKIGLGQKFVFEEPSDLTPPPTKPPRRPDPPSPALKSPTSPKSFPPTRPPPPRADSMVSRTKHHITPYKIQQELKLIDSKLTRLELKGRTLEDSIRKACEDDEDDLMISWFQLVNEKNELVRTECDYIYISRQQELEIEQEDIDKKLRALLNKPESCRTEADRKEEEYLTDRLLYVVDQRNNIVDSIDEDRLRYLEEDKDIEMMLQQKAFKETPVKPKKGKKKSKGLGFLKDSKEAKVKKEKTK